MRRFFLVLIFVAAAVAGAAAWWLHAPMASGGAAAIELEVEPGATPRAVAQAAAQAGLQVPPRLLWLWFRLSGEDRQIKAGNYEIPAGTTPVQLLQKLVRGDATMRTVMLIEGWNMRQVRAALAHADSLKPDTRGMDDAALMAALGRAGVSPEGRFFPDTYAYAKGSSDIAVLRRAMRQMDKRLDAAWAARAPGLPLASADQALILASLVEKETGRAQDRAQIAGVFINRLRAGMLLQTDPSVIYGLGAQFDGNLRKRDLQTDTPYNTYTRAGLPPTPIAMPGRAALLAAVQPESTKALYFVARGDGSSQFSTTLDQHNKAVNRYQRGGK
ncbi:MAG: aminodeoxychorismate lyase [Burkholderiales bacterium 66-5]|nr:MAG: aminodeoxychorismate lyase [Burkholderiales bacterium 66-5]